MSTIPEVRAAIARRFPSDPRATLTSPIDHTRAPDCAALLELINRLPTEALSRLSDADLAVFHGAVAEITMAVAQWRAGNTSVTLGRSLRTPLTDRPIYKLQQLLEKADQPPPVHGSNDQMFLKTVRPFNWGPFAPDTVLRLERDLTIITGSNDAGKSSLLRLLLCLGGRIGMTERDPNAAFLDSQGAAWQDVEVGAEATFEAIDTDATRSEGLQAGDEMVLRLKCRESHGASIQDRKFRRNGVPWSNPREIGFPIKVWLLDQVTLAEELAISSHVASEQSFLKLAFGSIDAAKRLASLNDLRFDDALARASDEITRRLSQVLPKTLSVGFRIRRIGATRERIGIMISDHHGGYVTLATRGAGVQKLLGLLIHLATLEPSLSHLILLDEPENALHADAQHSLRRFLEEVATSPNVQILYSTHSGAMINTFRPQAVRLIQRGALDGEAASTIEPVEGDLTSVRVSLGLSLADTLSLGPVTVIIEGKTEALGLPLAIRRLQESGAQGFEAADQVMACCTILDGEGDNFERVAQVVKRVGSRPIIFVDGDKARRIEQSSFRQHLPEVPVVVLGAGQEFEDLVHPTDYVAAIAEHLSKPEITEDAFKAWVEANPQPAQMMFSKRVGRWLESEFHTSLDKPTTMRLAIARSHPDDIVAAPLLALVDRVRDLLGQA